MKKIFGVIGIILVIFAFSLSTLVLALAHEEELDGIELGKQLVDSKASCNTLDIDQLEAVGDYIMEQMHPGEQHEAMETQMGGDGSETVKSAHITMAQHMYCGNYSYGGNIGMMNSGYGMMGYGGSSMMGYGSGMMSSGMFWLNGFLCFLLLVGLVALVWLWVFKVWNELTKKSKK